METSTYPSTSTTAGSVGEQVQQAAGEVGDQVSRARDAVQETAQRAAGQAQEQVQQLSGRARGQVRDQVDQRLTQTGEKLGSTVQDLRSVASELRNNDKAAPAKVADQVAERLDGVARYLSEADGERLLRDVEDFGRRQPWAVVAGGLALGFIASRFLRASSGRRYETGSTPAGPHTSTRSRDEIMASLEGSPYAPR